MSPAPGETESTIEFELSADELLESPGLHAPDGAAPTPSRSQAPRLRRPAIALALSIALACLVVGILARHTSKPAGHPPGPATTRMSDTEARQVLSTSFGKAEPVRIANPFDATEVFEFPPGTSREYAREAVAEYLLGRARDRHARQEQRSRNRREMRNS